MAVLLRCPVRAPTVPRRARSSCCLGAEGLRSAIVSDENKAKQLFDSLALDQAGARPCRCCTGAGPHCRRSAVDRATSWPTTSATPRRFRFAELVRVAGFDGCRRSFESPNSTGLDHYQVRPLPRPGLPAHRSVHAGPRRASPSPLTPNSSIRRGASPWPRPARSCSCNEDQDAARPPDHTDHPRPYRSLVELAPLHRPRPNTATTSDNTLNITACGSPSGLVSHC